MFQDEIKGFYVLNLPGLQPGLIDSGRFIVHQEGTQKQMCSASRKHSMMKNPNCSILKRMDTASSCLQGRRLTRWRTDSTLNSYWRLYVCFLSRQRKPLIPSPVFIKKIIFWFKNIYIFSFFLSNLSKVWCNKNFASISDFWLQDFNWMCARKKRSVQSASRGKAKSDVGGNEVSLEAAFGGRTKAANFLHMSSLWYGSYKSL